MDALPYSILQEIRQLKSEIAALKGANQLILSAIKGGKLSVLNENGVQVMLAGLDPQDDKTRWAAYSDLGERVAQAGNIAGTAFDNGAGFRANTRFNTSGIMVNDSGVVLPMISWPIAMAHEISNNDQILLTSATFQRVFYVEVHQVPSDAMLAGVVAIADAGTTLEMKWVCQPSGITSATLTHAGAGTYNNFDIRWTHGNTISSFQRFELHARRSVGAGVARVARPHKFIMTGKDFIVSSAGGW